jgi:hypothetical protein
MPKFIITISQAFRDRIRKEYLLVTLHSTNMLTSSKKPLFSMPTIILTKQYNMLKILLHYAANNL